MWGVYGHQVSLFSQAPTFANETSSGWQQVDLARPVRNRVRLFAKSRSNRGEAISYLRKRVTSAMRCDFAEVASAENANTKNTIEMEHMIFSLSIVIIAISADDEPRCHRLRTPAGKRS